MTKLFLITALFFSPQVFADASALCTSNDKTSWSEILLTEQNGNLDFDGLYANNHTKLTLERKSSGPAIRYGAWTEDDNYITVTLEDYLSNLPKQFEAKVTFESIETTAPVHKLTYLCRNH